MTRNVKNNLLPVRTKIQDGRRKQVTKGKIAISWTPFDGSSWNFYRSFVPPSETWKNNPLPARTKIKDGRRNQVRKNENRNILKTVWAIVMKFSLKLRSIIRNLKEGMYFRFGPKSKMAAGNSTEKENRNILKTVWPIAMKFSLELRSIIRNLKKGVYFRFGPKSKMAAGNK